METNNVVSLSRFRADVSAALTRRGQTLLSAADLKEQVAAMAPLELYYVVKEIGVEDAQPILSCASAQQMQACCDLDCWEADNFCPIELDAWLAGFAAQSTEALAEAFLRLDDEVQILFLAESLAIYDMRNEGVPELSDDIPHKVTLDGFFTLYAVKEEREIEPFLLVDALYKHDMHEAFRLLMATKWEILSETGESAFQFRAGRLEEMGFLRPEEAARLFAPPPSALKAPLDPDAPPKAQLVCDDAPMTMPALYAGAMHEATTRLGRALAHISDARHIARLEAELVSLINAATVAYGNVTKDLSGVMRVASYVRDTLSLGLERLLSIEGHDPEGEQADAQAAALVVRVALMHLFQLGFELVRPMQRAAYALSQDPVVAAWLGVALHPDDDTEAADRLFLRHLAQARPVLAGYTPLRPQDTKAWQSLSEINQTKDRLDALATRLV